MRMDCLKFILEELSTFKFTSCKETLSLCIMYYSFLLEPCMMIICDTFELQVEDKSYIKEIWLYYLGSTWETTVKTKIGNQIRTRKDKTARNAEWKGSDNLWESGPKFLP